MGRRPRRGAGGAPGPGQVEPPAVSRRHGFLRRASRRRRRSAARDPVGGDARVRGRRGRQPRQQGAVGTTPAARWCWPCAAVASIALAFVVGGEWNRRSSALGTPSRIGGGAGHRRDRGRARRPRSWNRVTPRRRQRNRATPRKTAAEPRDGRLWWRRSARRRPRASRGRVTSAGQPLGPARSLPAFSRRRCDAARHRAVELNGHLIHIDLTPRAVGAAGGL